jgi:hypothetical protein
MHFTMFEKHEVLCTEADLRHPPCAVSFSSVYHKIDGKMLLVRKASRDTHNGARENTSGQVLHIRYNNLWTESHLNPRPS